MASDEADNEVSPYEQLEEERISLKGQLANLRGRCADLEEERVSAVNFSRASTEVISRICYIRTRWRRKRRKTQHLMIVCWQRYQSWKRGTRFSSSGRHLRLVLPS